MLVNRVAVAAIAAILATAAAAQPPAASLRDVSWGKAGVSLLQYRLDAGECAAQAIGQDITGTQEVQLLVRASRELDNLADTAWMEMASYRGGLNGLGSNAGIRWQQTVNKYRPDEQFAAIKRLQYKTLDACLAERGYSRFQLTADQVQQLRHLKHGSEARRAYLHSLASDPDVMERQRI